MNVFLAPTPLVEPFNDDNAAIPIGNKLLSEWQEETLSALGLKRIETLEKPCLVLPSNCFIETGALRQFLSGAAGKNSVLVLRKGRFADSSTHVQRNVTSVEEGWRFEAIRYLSETDEPVQDVVVDPKELTIDLPLNSPYLAQKTLEIGLPRHPVMQLDHWVHILWANQMVGGMTALAVPKWRWILRLIWTAFKRLSLNKWKILSGINKIGKGCDIHPTAVIEGATLGDNVTVGPYARVLMSHLDSGSVIMAGAQVEFSTLGKRAMVSEHSVLRFSLLYERAVASQYLMQQCILGTEAVTTGAAFTMDLNFDRSIRVPLDGVLHDTGQQFLGCAFGHRARIGTGFWLASGRSIPNDYFLIRDPEDTLSKIPTDLPINAPLIVKGKTLIDPSGGP